MENQEEPNIDYLFKFLIIGDELVGKSKLVLNYVDGQFTSEYKLTLGVEIRVKDVEIKNKTYRIQIWDTAGQENFRSITRAYYKNSVCALVVYDISSRDSFNNVSTWIEDCRNQSPKTIFMVLVGNKSDLADKRQVSTEEGQELAEKYGLQFYETSAKTGENVNDIFYDSADEIAKKIDQNYYDLENDTCGIKQGINRQNHNPVLNLGGGGRQKEDKGCC